MKGITQDNTDGRGRARRMSLALITAIAAVAGFAPQALAQVGSHDHTAPTLNVSTSGGTGTVSGRGISCGSDCTETYPFEEECEYVGEGGNHNSGRTQCEQVYPNVTLQVVPGNGQTFTGWSGACSGTGDCRPNWSGSQTNVVANFRDGIGPLATLTAPAADAIVKGTTTFSATATDNQSVASVEFFITRNGNTFSIGKDLTEPYSTAFDTRGSDGNVTWHVQAKDNFGNEVTTAARPLKIDNTGPTGALTSPSPNTSIRGPVTVSANASDVVAGVQSVQFFVNDASSPFAADTTAPYSASQDTSAFPDGPLRLSAVAIDKAGNETRLGSVNVTIDNTAPELRVEGSVLDGSYTRFKEPYFEYSATDLHDVAFFCALDAADPGPCGDGTYRPGTLADGEYTVTITARDAVGNTDVYTATFYVDTVGPEVGISNAPKKFKTKKVTFEFGPLFRGVQFFEAECKIDDGPWGGCRSPATFKVKPGKHVFSVRGYDAAGNMGPEESHAFKVVKKKRK